MFGLEVVGQGGRRVGKVFQTKKGGVFQTKETRRGFKPKLNWEGMLGLVVLGLMGRAGVRYASWCLAS